MRIKKIAPVTPANGNIENSYGTSQTNGYSQEYLNKFRIQVSADTITSLPANTEITIPLNTITNIANTPTHCTINSNKELVIDKACILMILGNFNLGVTKNMRFSLYKNGSEYTFIHDGGGNTWSNTITLNWTIPVNAGDKISIVIKNFGASVESTSLNTRQLSVIEL